VVAEYGDGGDTSDEVDADVAASAVDPLARHLAGAAADASIDINMNGHLNPSGLFCRRRP
jgi:hypothetical protein